MNAEIDIRPVLRSIRVPTLVIHRTGDMCLGVDEGRYVAERIPGAKFVELPGVDHLPFVGDQEAILDEIEEFLTGARHRTDHDLVLATVLTIEIVGAPPPSPDSAASVSHGMLYRFVSHVRKEVELFRGRAAGLTDEAVLATFDGPARAIRCAWAVLGIARRLGIEVRAGIHTGECDVQGDAVTGPTVVVCAEVARLAGIGEIVVSGTVKDIVAGSGIDFADRGGRNFDRYGDMRLFAVTRCT
jgi:class 3 adenylate cyclase